MISAAFLLGALIVQPPAAVPAKEPEIVVTGTRRGRCEVRLADRTLSRRDLARHAGEWARLGHPVRVVRPAGAGYRCLARVAFRLNDLGVRLIHFVDREEVRR